MRGAAQALVIAALSGIALAGHGATPASGDKAFLRLEQTWVAALRTHDTQVLNEILDDSFIDSTFKGTVRTKRDVLSGPPAGGRYRSVGFEDLHSRRYGRTAIVTGVNVLDGGTASDIVRIRFTDVFVLEGGHWRAVSAQETLLNAAVHSRHRPGSATQPIHGKDRAHP